MWRAFPRALPWAGIRPRRWRSGRPAARPIGSSEFCPTLQAEQKLDERQAWGKSYTVKTIPAIVLCRAHNLWQLCNATRKTAAAIADTKVITAYYKNLDRRAAKAKAA